MVVPADVSTTDACSVLRTGGNVSATVGALGVGALVGFFDGARVGRDDGCLGGKSEGIVVGGENGLVDGAIIGESDGCSDAVGDDDDSRDRSISRRLGRS